MFHCSLKTISRSSGRSATGAIAYRTASKVYCERYGVTHDYTRKSGVEYTKIYNSNIKDTEALWNQIEKKETRKNSTVAREITISIPHEIDKETMIKSVDEFSLFVAEKYDVAVQSALHAPHSEGDQRNWHAHIMFSTRDSRGLKTRVLDDQKTGKTETIKIREKWSLICTKLVSEEKQEEWSHLSYAERKIQKTPMIKMGVIATNFERKTGMKSQKRTEYEQSIRTQKDTGRITEFFDAKQKEIDRPSNRIARVSRAENCPREQPYQSDRNTEKTAKPRSTKTTIFDRKIGKIGKRKSIFAKKIGNESRIFDRQNRWGALVSGIHGRFARFVDWSKLNPNNRISQKPTIHQQFTSAKERREYTTQNPHRSPRRSRGISR